ncbi:uncharacterized protein A1O9_10742 [Exophiala aquamarina CBS 119918]|uniref:Cdc37 Hsp90 binding domain-containing protein n=1 Tax=Exophiala aquamarina CBS 119918 TaxID=1182545 RepID=A0A072NZM4_9EURO|nr:uncharacterized protein A1O9_10742 [Exophiala aquamarina CBS 119918]KEF53294.1 hypothetical protein A1O9_10742 [Exophiala aquamarina CBS 119918]
MSNHGDAQRRRYPTTADDRQPYQSRHAGSRRVESDRPALPQNDDYDAHERAEDTPRSSELPVYRNPIFRRGSEPRTDDYAIRAPSQSGTRLRDGEFGDDHRTAAAWTHDNRQQSPERVIIRTSRAASGRAPSSYHYQARSPRNPQEDPNERVSVANQDPLLSRTRRLSYSQDSEYPYTSSAPHGQHNKRAVHYDDSPNQHGLAIGQRVHEVDATHENAIASGFHDIQKNHPGQPAAHQVSSASITSTSGAAPGTSVQTPISLQTSNHLISARAAESSFRSSLSPRLQQFANILRNDWTALEIYVTKDPTILDAEQQQFLKEAVQAFSIGKDAYANQCIHRVALLQQVEDCSFKEALKEIQNIGERKSVAKDFLEAYDRIQKAAKKRAKAMPAPAAGQCRDSQQPLMAGVAHPSPLDLQSAFPVNQISSVQRGDSSSHQENSFVTRHEQHTPAANSSATYHRGSQSSNVEHQDGLGHRGARTYQYVVRTRDSPFSAGSPPSSGPLSQANYKPNDINPPNYPGPRGPAILPSVQPDSPDDVEASTPVQHHRQSGSVASITEFSVTGDNTFPLPSGKQGQLDSRFQPRPHSFYKVGKVFAVLWHVPGSTDPPKGHISEKRVLTVGKYNEPIYSTIRRMVVVREGHGYCVCIQINTYGGRGLKKFSRTPGEIDNHSIIHMADAPSSYIKDEPRSSKKPIAVERATQYQKLEPESRLCYSQPSTVQHNVKAMPVGQVTPKCLPWLVHYYKQANG